MTTGRSLSVSVHFLLCRTSVWQRLDPPVVNMMPGACPDHTKQRALPATSRIFPFFLTHISPEDYIPVWFHLSRRQGHSDRKQISDCWGPECAGRWTVRRHKGIILGSGNILYHDHSGGYMTKYIYQNSLTIGEFYFRKLIPDL